MAELKKYLHCKHSRRLPALVLKCRRAARSNGAQRLVIADEVTLARSKGWTVAAHDVPFGCGNELRLQNNMATLSHLKFDTFYNFDAFFITMPFSY
jgi:hypothetical protein